MFWVHRNAGNTALWQGLDALAAKVRREYLRGMVRSRDYRRWSVPEVAAWVESLCPPEDYCHPRVRLIWQQVAACFRNCNITGECLATASGKPLSFAELAAIGVCRGAGVEKAALFRNKLKAGIRELVDFASRQLQQQHQQQHANECDKDDEDSAADDDKDGRIRRLLETWTEPSSPPADGLTADGLTADGLTAEGSTHVDESGYDRRYSLLYFYPGLSDHEE
jgi:hypothetical protein